LESVGVSASLESLGLSRKPPSCITYNVNSGEFEWRDEYRDGGKLSHERKYPIIYFSSSKFPECSAIGWVLAKDLRLQDEYTLQPSAVPYCGVARAFMKRRTSRRISEDKVRDPDSLLSMMSAHFFKFIPDSD
jgi:hypothetical protein